MFGDALAELLAFAGFDVTREYYINDAARRSRSSRVRSTIATWRRLGDAPGPVPQGLYPLEDLLPVARAIAARDGDRWRGRPEAEWLDVFGREGVATMLAQIKADLGGLGVQFDVFTSERDLVEAGRVDAALAYLDELGLLYTGTLPPPKGKPVDDWEPVPQLLFKASEHRRRHRPAAQALDRCVDLFRGRSRLSPGQVPARLRPDDRCLGRRSRRLRQADAGRRQGA